MSIFENTKLELRGRMRSKYILNLFGTDFSLVFCLSLGSIICISRDQNNRATWNWVVFDRTAVRHFLQFFRWTSDFSLESD